MVSSDRFLKLARRLRREPELSAEERIERLRGFFFTSMREQPESLCYDLFDHWSEEAESSPEWEPFERLSERLANIVDLFQLDYDETNDPLEPEDWDFIRDAVSESAGEMDVKTITYIMQHVVDRGRL